jgi:peptide-methionine (S)-S-oxide reductase
MKVIYLLMLSFVSCKPSATHQDSPQMQVQTQDQTAINLPDSLEVITLAAGCFWCVEAVFQDLRGVEKVESGYAGGSVLNPTYREVCSGTTGHAEACQIYYDPKQISLEEILEVFWTTHNPTTLNRQGGDIGTQYRSAIFYHNEQQKLIAEKSKAEVANTIWDEPAVTEISPFTNFFKAEAYHQNYYSENSHAPYCQMVIAPKIVKLRHKFADKLKKQE